jgi:hypothetical protein
MTPKEKAKEICNKFSWEKIEDGYKMFQTLDETKRCALIAVDEIQQLIKDLSSCSSRFIYIIDEMNYWNEVKQEIEKL